jgi:predicted nucleic acid-binding protein
LDCFVVYITPTIAGEIGCGDSRQDRESWAKSVAFFRPLEIIPEVSGHYSSTFRYLKENGLMIGQNDLWIAATALVYDHPVVTRNTSEFTRVPRLKVLGFQMSQLSVF